MGAIAMFLLVLVTLTDLSSDDGSNSTAHLQETGTSGIALYRGRI